MITLVQKIPVPERGKRRRKAKPQAASTRARMSADQARIDKWIRDRLIDWRDSCWRCRRPITFGQTWAVISNGEVTARFHQLCYAEWLAQQEVAARRALGMETRQP
jgi:hypothetical protein